MKPVFVMGSIFLALGASHAVMAQTCSGNKLSATAIQTLVAGKYACYGPGAYPNVQWNELHTGTSSGTVTDYKKGPSDPVDPTKAVGTYAITGTNSAIITYTYSDGGGAYGYNVYANLGTASPNPGNYSFCTTGGGVNLPVTVGLTTGNGGCP